MRTIKKLLLSVALTTILLSGQVHAGQCYTYEDSSTFTVYGYCSCEKCSGKSDKLTYTETTAMQDRTIAVDPEVIPLGSTVLIYYDNSLIGIYQAEDVGGDIKGNVIDVYFENHKTALEFGVKECEVIVVDAKG